MSTGPMMQSQGQPESKVDRTLVNALLAGHPRASLPTVCIPLGVPEHLSVDAFYRLFSISPATRSPCSLPPIPLPDNLNREIIFLSALGRGESRPAVILHTQQGLSFPGFSPLNTWRIYRFFGT